MAATACAGTLSDDRIAAVCITGLFRSANYTRLTFWVHSTYYFRFNLHVCMCTVAHVTPPRA